MPSGSNSFSDVQSSERRCDVNCIDPELKTLLASFHQSETGALYSPKRSSAHIAQDKIKVTENLVSGNNDSDVHVHPAPRTQKHRVHGKKNSSNKARQMPHHISMVDDDGGVSSSESDETDDSESEKQLLAAMEKLAEQRRMHRARKIEKIDNSTTAKMKKTMVFYEKTMLQRLGSVSKRISDDSEALIEQLRNSNKKITALKRKSQLAYQKAQSVSKKLLDEISSARESFRSEVATFARVQKVNSTKLSLALKKSIRKTESTASKQAKFTKTLENIVQLIKSEQ